jgi:hypothetical protein
MQKIRRCSPLGAVVPQKETALPYVDFMAIKAAVSIEDAANLLKLTLKKSGKQLRSNCPACGNEDERIVVITPLSRTLLLLRCKSRRRLFGTRPAHNRVGHKDAAAFLVPYRGCCRRSELLCHHAIHDTEKGPPPHVHVRTGVSACLLWPR